jgi:ankyrin repeat protein
LKALCHAASNGNIDCIRFLLDHGADPTIYTQKYQYAWDLASINGYSEVTNKQTNKSISIIKFNSFCMIKY